MAGPLVATDSTSPTGSEPEYVRPGPVDFESVYRSEWHRVLGLAIALTGDRGAAEDLTQEAFVAAYRDWDRIGAYDQPGAFLRRVVVNRSVSRTRRQFRERGALARLAGRRRDPGIPHELDEAWSHVRRLPPRQAQVFALTYLDDLPLHAVAEILGIGTETAKTHLSRARDALARTLSSPAPLEEHP
jgi:RNA polymerase sigma-70 factor, ECF subfamily